MKESKGIKLSPDLKRKIIFFPVVGIFGVLFLYFTIFYESKEEEIKNQKVYDYSLPNGKDNKLPEGKTEVINQYDQFKRKKDYLKNNSSFKNFSDIVTMDPEEPSKEEVKIDEKITPEEDAVKKIQEKLLEQERLQRERNLKRTQSYSSNSNYSNTGINSKKENWKKETKNDFDSFFEVDNNQTLSRNNRNNYYDEKSNYKTKAQMINAYVSGDQTVTDDDIIEMRLSKNSNIDGYYFEKNTSFFGTVSLKNKRVFISITNINHKPLNLKVYDKRDGNIGFFVKERNFGGEVNEVFKDETIDNVDVSDPVLNGGINTIKNIVRKKNKEKKVTILNNTQLILK